MPLSEDDQRTAFGYAEEYVDSFIDLQRRFLNEGKSAVHDPAVKAEVMVQIKEKINIDKINPTRDPRIRERLLGEEFQKFLYIILDEMVDARWNDDPKLDCQAHIFRVCNTVQPSPSSKMSLPVLQTVTSQLSASNDSSAASAVKVKSQPLSPAIFFQVSTEPLSSSSWPPIHERGRDKASVCSSTSSSTLTPVSPASSGNPLHVPLVRAIPKGPPRPIITSKSSGTSTREARSRAEKAVEQGRKSQDGNGITQDKGKKAKETAVDDNDMVEEDDPPTSSRAISPDNPNQDDSMDLGEGHIPGLNHPPPVISATAMLPSEPPPPSPTSSKRKRESFDEGVSNRSPATPRFNSASSSKSSLTPFSPSPISSSHYSSQSQSVTSKFVKAEDDEIDTKDHLLVLAKTYAHITEEAHGNILDREQIIREQDQLIDDLNGQIYTLEKQNAALQFAHSQSEVTSEVNLQAALDEAMELLEAERAINAELRDAKTSLDEKIQSLQAVQLELGRQSQLLLEVQASLAAKSSSYDNLSATLERTQVEFAEAIKSLADARANLEAKTAEYHTLSTMLDSTGLKVDEQVKLTTVAEARLADKTQSYNSLSDTLTATQRERHSTVGALVAERDVLIDRLAAERRYLSAAQARITSLENQFRVVKEEKEQTSRDWSAALEDCVCKDNEIETLNVKLELQVNHGQKLLDATNSRIRLLKDEKDCAVEKAKVEAEKMYKQSLDNAKAEIESLKQEKVVMAEKSEKEEKEAKEAMRLQSARTQQLLDNAKAEIESLKQEKVVIAEKSEKEKEAKEAMRLQSARTQQSLDNAKAEIESLKQEKVVMAEQLEKEVNKAKEICNQAKLAKDDVERARVREDDLRREKQKLKNEADSSHQELETLRNAADSSRQEIETLRSDVHSSRQEIETLRSDAHSSRQEIENLRNVAATARQEKEELQFQVKLADSRFQDALQEFNRQGAKVAKEKKTLQAELVGAQEEKKRMADELDTFRSLMNRSLNQIAGM
ncbi:hypothetical protein D9758_005504 [Tetrapyrgos nigripes]|uniref:Uncharacterized protein n=1 Tax=Tetrapyrgos nigripes TaxID=182062 RepID=A0A8H5LNX2_9AGAR|nr:hypothetical protein D9758_005504 [Tetrapyrgos nigripes]